MSHTVIETSMLHSASRESTSATPDIALASSVELASRRQWQDVLDSLLLWLADGERARYEGFDPVQHTCLESAIDFVVDARDAGSTPPTAFSPTADGGVSFQWRNGDEVTEIEILDSDTAEFTEIKGANVRRHGVLLRDPLTRRLEFQR